MPKDWTRIENNAGVNGAKPGDARENLTDQRPAKGPAGRSRHPTPKAACGNCGHENAATANFCEECGRRRSTHCPACGTYMSAMARYCPQCGQVRGGQTQSGQAQGWGAERSPGPAAGEEETEKRGLEHERKQATVLFADIAESIELVAAHDPEEARALFFSPVLERMIDAVRQFDGTVTSVRGDGIMALFGAPLAVEDHAVRACHAGLRMQEQINRYAQEILISHGVRLAIRVGAASGEIVGHVVGNDLNAGSHVIGQTAWLASRMEQMAAPGTMFTTADTVGLAEHYVATKLIGRLPVKGLAEPVEVYEVTGAGAARNRIQVSARRGLTRFVGRGDEMTLLADAVRDAGAGDGQTVALVGEAGVGKSRMAHEALRAARSAGWLVLEANSKAFSHAAPYAPIIELVRHYFEIEAQDGASSIRAKVTDRMMARDPALEDSIAPILDLLDVLGRGHPFRSIDPPLHRRRTYEAVVALISSASRERPLAALIEDLHWTDALSLGLLNELVLATRNARFLLVATYRPEFETAWRGRPGFREVRLGPLEGGAVNALLSAVLGHDGRLTDLKRFLTGRTGGNPFFIEEIVRTFVGKGVLAGTAGHYSLAKPFSEADMPPTVRAVLAARIDLLPPPEKRLLQIASVIGRDVPFALLRAMCGLKDDRLQNLLDSLQSTEFLFSTQLFPDAQHAFKHALTHDVAYAGMLRERRRELHARVVESLETLYRDRTDELADQLARHAVLGELRDKAVRYLRQASAKATARSAQQEARDWLEQALDILDTMPESRAVLEQAFDMRLELRVVLRHFDDNVRMVARLREAEALAGRLNDDRRSGQVLAVLSAVHSSFGDQDEALATGLRAMEIAERLGDSRLGVAAAIQIGQAHYFLGDHPRVAAAMKNNPALLSPDGSSGFFMGVSSVMSRVPPAMSLAELGRFAEAATYAEEAVALAEATGHLPSVVWACLAASMVYLVKGDFVRAHAHVEQWREGLRPTKATGLTSWAEAASAWTLARRGETGAARDRIREAMRMLDDDAGSRGPDTDAQPRNIVHLGWAYHAVGHACLLLGQLDEARRLADRAIEFARNQTGFKAHALLLRAGIASYPSQLDRGAALADYEHARSLAAPRGMRPLIARCHRGLARLHGRMGETARERENAAIAIQMFHEMDMEPASRDETNP